jgi:hypothetical protein
MGGDRTVAENAVREEEILARGGRWQVGLGGQRREKEADTRDLDISEVKGLGRYPFGFWLNGSWASSGDGPKWFPTAFSDFFISFPFFFSVFWIVS